MKKKFTDLAGYSPDDASDIGIRIRLLAGEIYSIGTAVDWLKRQSFAQTANGQELEYRAQERGLSRKNPVQAHGILTFSRDSAIWFDVPVAAGTVCSTAGANPVRYVTTGAAVLKANTLSVDVPAQAEEGGSAGNAEAGSITVAVTIPTGIQAVNNASAFAGGEDEESDSALRSRLLQSSASASNGANAAYYRDYALSCDGVDSASVVPRANGAGTVALYLGGRGCAPSDAVVAKISGDLNAAREICTQVTVAAAQMLPVNVTASVTAAAGLDSSEVSAACETAVRNYFDGLGVSEPVVPAALNAALFSTGMIRNCTLSVGTASVSQNQMAVCGTITVTVTQGG
ncbi:baseplate protein J [Caproiciproducens sp. NJN-50]|uniref:baseplate J/gp47 family protein n=1 Tax=Acutalibacteraceae TaxID=3082771 RepID=UPI000FFE2E78|nr:MULTISPECIES: baseplate J/gp47 family protein [Acutalibacteraceae]QAT48510.1 baseplate protein J [Caproiciproducens sp. NJN-50]